MGILDRLFRRSRMDRFDDKHFLNDEEKDDIKNEVKKVYQNILDGKITKERGKEDLLEYITKLMKKKYPKVDFEKSGLAGKINRYVSMKIRTLDQDVVDEDFEYEDYTGKMVSVGKRGLGLGEASRLGKIGKVKNALRKRLDAIKKREGLTAQQAYSYLMEYARSEGIWDMVFPERLHEYDRRNLVLEVITESGLFDENGDLKEPPEKPKTPGLGRKRKAKKGVELFPKPYVDGAERAVGIKAGEEYYESKAVKEEVLGELEGVLESIPGLKSGVEEKKEERKFIT